MLFRHTEPLLSWFSHHLLLKPIGYVPTAPKFEAHYYRQLAESAILV